MKAALADEMNNRSKPTFPAFEAVEATATKEAAAPARRGMSPAGNRLSTLLKPTIANMMKDQKIPGEKKRNLQEMKEIRGKETDFNFSSID